MSELACHVFLLPGGRELAAAARAPVAACVVDERFPPPPRGPGACPRWRSDGLPSQRDVAQQARLRTQCQAAQAWPQRDRVNCRRMAGVLGTAGRVYHTTAGGRTTTCRRETRATDLPMRQPTLRPAPLHRTVTSPSVTASGRASYARCRPTAGTRATASSATSASTSLPPPAAAVADRSSPPTAARQPHGRRQGPTYSDP